MAYLVNTEQVRTAARAAGSTEEDLDLSGIAVLTFSQAIVERLDDLCHLSEVEWLKPHVHPYGVPQLTKRGSYAGLGVTVVVPPMGASPLACTIEELVACRASAVFLACAAWSLGPPVRFGDVIVPSFAVGPDGTSLHYGNAEGRIEADPSVVSALVQSARAREASLHVAGNASCEALYRVTEEMVASFRTLGCVSMENGEAATLFAVCRSLGVPGGAVFQPYIDLTEGWNPGRLDDAYRATCRLQAEIVLDAAVRLRGEGAA